MRKNFDKFLLGLLWLLTITLAACFWLNTFYGFNIFSGAHWAYLSEIQASRAPIKSDFYLSILIFIVIGISGLYLLIRPRFRKIKLAPNNRLESVPATTEQKKESVPEQTKTEPEQIKEQKMPAPGTVNIPGRRALSRPMSPAIGVRSVSRPTSPITSTYTPPLNSGSSAQSSATQTLNKDIQNILESGNYIVKTCNNLADIKNAIVSLAFDNKIWVISANNSTENLQNAVNGLQSICMDTLGETASMLNINGIVINPTDTSASDSVQTFKNLDEFDNFIKNNPNTEPEDFDKELFDAVSTYLSTVLMNIGTL